MMWVMIYLKANLHVAADVIDKKGQMEEFMFLGLRMNEGSQEKPLRGHLVFR